MVPIGVGEFDKIGHLSFGDLRGGAAAPRNALGRELSLPIGELLRAADIESQVAQHRLRRRRRRDAMLKPIRPDVGDGSIRRSTNGKSQQIASEFL